MPYIKIIIFSLLLSSCATTDNSSRTENTKSSGVNPFDQSDSDKRLYNKALTFLNKGKLDDAKEIFEVLQSDRPELAGPYANLAVIALQEKKPDEALKLAEISVTKNPKLSRALNLLGYLKLKNGNVLDALKHYKSAIKYKNDYALAHYNIALLYDVYMQDVQSAILHYEKYMKLIDGKDKTTADWLEQLRRNNENS